MNQITPLALLLLATTWTVPATANQCGTLQIEIANDTHFECRLMNTEVIHGILDYQLPRILSPNHHLVFDTQQTTLYGPDVRFVYRCNGSKIEFESQQSFCHVYAGSIIGTSEDSDNIFLEYYKNEGSRYYDKPGRITWVIQERQRH